MQSKKRKKKFSQLNFGIFNHFLFLFTILPRSNPLQVAVFLERAYVGIVWEATDSSLGQKWSFLTSIRVSKSLKKLRDFLVLNVISTPF